MFVAAHRHHGVVPICRVLQVAPSAVRSAMARPVCARRQADDTIKPMLLAVFDANCRVYGRRKMKAALRREHGINVDKDRIARLMAELGIRGATRTKSTVTTRSDRSSPRAPDLVNRQFTASRPNELWVCDSTDVPTWSGFAYTASSPDVFSRMIVGWRTASSMTADLVTDALERLSSPAAINSSDLLGLAILQWALAAARADHRNVPDWGYQRLIPRRPSRRSAPGDGHRPLTLDEGRTVGVLVVSIARGACQAWLRRAYTSRTSC